MADDVAPAREPERWARLSGKRANTRDADALAERSKRGTVLAHPAGGVTPRAGGEPGRFERTALAACPDRPDRRRGSCPDNDGRVVLLRLDPGTVAATHRHTGKARGFSVEGDRRLLDAEEIIGPGDSVDEPAGDVDGWMAVGDTTVPAFGSVWVPWGVSTTAIRSPARRHEVDTRTDRGDGEANGVEPVGGSHLDQPFECAARVKRARAR